MSFDCRKCPGYCCSIPRVAVSEHDIARLARHFGVSAAVARKRYTYRYRAEGISEQILRRRKDKIFDTTCALFDTVTRQCTVYEARPNVCRKYPYGDRCGYYSFLKFERDFHDDPDFVPSA